MVYIVVCLLSDRRGGDTVTIASTLRVVWRGRDDGTKDVFPGTDVMWWRTAKFLERTNDERDGGDTRKR